MENLEGKLITLIYHNKENDFQIIKISSAVNKDIITVSGYFKNLKKNATYQFLGEYKNHPKYGHQFICNSFIEMKDNSKEGIINYLSSEIFTGIGPKTALKIYDILGSNCIKIILDDVEALKKVGLSGLKKTRFFEELRKNQLYEQVLIQLNSYNISSKVSTKLIEKYKFDCIKIVEENPYKLINDIEGFGFIKADELAEKINFDLSSIKRISASITYILNNVCNSYGYTYVYKEQLIQAVSTFLNKKAKIENTRIEETLAELILGDYIYLEEDRYYIKDIYLSEVKIAAKLKELSNNKSAVKYDTYLLNNAIFFVENSLGIQYSLTQKEAIINALNSNVSILTGGPGTGKTTVVNGILKVYAYLNDIDLNKERDTRIMLMAPTGKASKRMQETTKYYASTIHRQLGYNFEEGFFYNEEQFLPASLIIIDEFSMVDVYLAWNLFSAIHSNCKVVIVGDVDQLASVGPGEVLNDLIESNIMNTIMLSEIHRQAKDSNIIKLSYECKNGNLTNDVFNSSDDVIFYKTDSSECKDVVLKYLDKIVESGYDLYTDVQVLAPMYKGEVGIDILNYEIQKKFNHREEEMIFQSKSYKIGDKVIQTKNDKDKNIMNGEIGVITDFYKDSNEKEYLVIDFDGINVKYSKEDLENLVHAYAISVHKSQGSEYKIVILPIVKGYSFMLKRKLIYTAITRAKQKLIIIGDLYYMQMGINRFDEKRQTSLKNRLISSQKVHITKEKGLCFEIEETKNDEISPYDFLN